jgi:asparagine synthase (glutamine-hydrolysing)
MSEKLAHRGPDGAGLQWFEAASFGLAHRRLAIIDLSEAAAQPMQVADRYWLSFNGEIYNYLELKEELLALGATFKNESDAEVLLQAFNYWGESCLNRLNGMYAFAIYDIQENTLFCARDPYGVKPFYYLNNEAHFGFASEIKALLNIPSYQLIANKATLLTFFGQRKIETTTEGFFKEIFELQPGYILRYDFKIKQLVTSRFFQATTVAVKEAKNQLKTELENAVKMRLRADVPIGFCLSGGLDSSSLLYLANQIRQKDNVGSLSNGLHAFTAAHDSPLDERTWAEQMVNHTNAIWHVSELKSSELVEALPKLIYHQDIPLLSTSTFAQSSVMKRAAEEGVKILIDGQGGDELFAGYEVFYPTFLKELFFKGKWVVFAREWRQLRNSPTNGKFVIKEWGKDLLSFLPNTFQIWLLKRNNPSLAYLNEFEPLKRKRFQVLQQHLTDYCLGHELKSLLRWEDRCSMQYSIESRTPFADDTRLIEIARSLAPNELIQNGWSKFILRDSLDKQLPSAISWRRDKKGFSVPESQWLMERSSYWQEFIKEKAHLDKSGIVDSSKLSAELPRIFSHEKYAKEQNFAFRYVCYLIWIEQFNITLFN